MANARPNPQKVRNLVVVLGDQLTPAISSLRDADPERDLVLMVEVMEEATYVRHHKKKIAFLFSAMRHFSEELRGLGYTVSYRRLEDTGATGTFTSEVAAAVARHTPERVVVTEPGEWRVLEAMRKWQSRLGCSVLIRADSRFLCTHSEFATWASSRSELRMEYFYRDMRRKTGLLMRAGKPEGGQWNFDKENRKSAKGDLFMPKQHRVEPDAITREVLALTAERFTQHIGHLEPFWFAVTRKDAEHAFERFIDHALAQFGDYQDAMLKGEKFLYHSILSLYINCGLLDPLDVCRKVQAAYVHGKVPLNAAEGFIRQIIGWREYVRGVYWLKMPSYASGNFFNHKAPLPSFYWTGETDMLCLKEAIGQTLEEAYAHHIQRLMVTGNFALLAGVEPREVHEWYLMVYADAYEWVEMPNTLGMSQFADGGLLGSKPYIASGAYIDRMSDYCGPCRYNVKERTGPDACPFNALYWHFLARHRRRLDGLPRMAQMYRTYDKFDDAEKKRIEKSASSFMASISTAPVKKAPAARG
jgi:deoxyribodipyrimidine photolyase-related protein